MEKINEETDLNQEAENTCDFIDQDENIAQDKDECDFEETLEQGLLDEDRESVEEEAKQELKAVEDTVADETEGELEVTESAKEDEPQEELEEVEVDKVDEALDEEDDCQESYIEDSLQESEDMEEKQEIVEEDASRESQDTPSNSLSETFEDTARKSFNNLKDYHKSRLALKDEKKHLEQLQVSVLDKKTLYESRRNIEINYDELKAESLLKIDALKTSIEELRSDIEVFENDLADTKLQISKFEEQAARNVEPLKKQKSIAKDSFATCTRDIKDAEARKVVCETRLKDLIAKKDNKVEALDLEIKEALSQSQKYTDVARAFAVGNKSKLFEAKEKAELFEIKAKNLSQEKVEVEKELSAQIAFAKNNFNQANDEYEQSKNRLAESKEKFEETTKAFSDEQTEVEDKIEKAHAKISGLNKEIEQANIAIEENRELIADEEAYLLQMDSVIATPGDTSTLFNEITRLNRQIKEVETKIAELEKDYEQKSEKSSRERVLVAVLISIILLIILFSIF